MKKTTIIYSDKVGSPRHTLLLPNWVVKHVLTGLVKKGKVIHVPRPECSCRTNQRRESKAIFMQSKQFAAENEAATR